MIVAVYADGGVCGANPSSVGGSWAWCHVDESGARVAHDSGFLQATPKGILKQVTNNQTEFLALLRGLEALPKGWGGTIATDSQVTLNRFFYGWSIKNVPHEWIGRLRMVLDRLDTMRLQPLLVNGHPTKAELVAGVGKRGLPTSEHNVYVDQLCGLAIKTYRERMSREPA